MITSGRFIERARTFAPGHFGLGETVCGDDIHFAGAQFSREIDQLSSHAFRNLFPTQHDAPQIFAPHSELRRLMKYVINERRHANQHIRLDLLNEPKIAFGAHYFSAAGARGKDAKRRAPVVGLPEGQMRCVRKQIHDAHFAVRTAYLEKPFPGERKVVQIVSGEQKGNGIGRPPRRARHENRPELGFKTLLHPLAPA